MTDLSKVFDTVDYEILTSELDEYNCVKTIHIGIFSGPYFPAFRRNTERYGVRPRNQSDCRKIRTRKTPNTDTFYAVCEVGGNNLKWSKYYLSYRKQLIKCCNLNTTLGEKICCVIKAQFLDHFYYLFT